MAPLDNPAVPKGSVVLVTGVNGFLGSHVAKQFLEFGYKVRGTVRDPAKNSWLSNAFDNQYGQGNFELVKLADMTSEEALKEVVKGTTSTNFDAQTLKSDHSRRLCGCSHCFRYVT